jgi:hypothetical protein
VCGGVAVLGAADVQRGGAPELDLTPFQIDNLRGAETMAIGNEDQRRVTMAITAAAGRADEPLDLGRREIFADP